MIGKKTGFPRRTTPFLAPFETPAHVHRPKQRVVIESRPYGVCASALDLTGKCRAPMGLAGAGDAVTGGGLTDGSPWFLTRRREAASVAVPLDSR